MSTPCRRASGGIRHRRHDDIRGSRFVVRGIDPAGVDRRYVYLEDAKTGKSVSVTFEEPSRATRNDAVLHLVEDEEPA
jgi:hypothetical protein